MSDAGTPASPAAVRARRIGAPALVVLSVVCAFVAVFAVWADRQAVEPDGWHGTAELLVEDPVVQDALAAHITDELYRYVDVPGLLRDALPDRYDVLALPAAGALREAVQRGAKDALESAMVQRLLTRALDDTHELAIQVLRGAAPGLETEEGGRIVLDLRAVLDGVATRVGVGAGLALNIPEEAGRVEILQADALTRAQSALRALEAMSILMPLLAIALFAAALWVAEGRRRETLRLAGVGFILAGALVPLTRSSIGEMVIDAIDPAPANLAAAERTWEISTSLLSDGAVALVSYGVIILLGALVAGPTRAAVGLRRALRRVSDPHLAYPLGGALLLLVLWWGPTESLRRPLTALSLLVLLAVGLEVLRRQVEREAAAEGAVGGERTFDMGGLAERVTAPMRRWRGGGSEDRMARLERVQRLHASGVLTDEEFAAEKRRILEE